MIDTTDQGFVYNPRTQPGGGVGEQEDAIAGVRILQVSGRYTLGGSDSRSFERSDNTAQQVDSYFLLDTQFGKHTNFPCYDALRRKAQEFGIVLKLESIEAVYGRYRFTGFDIFVVLLFCLPPLACVALLVTWIIRVRKTRGIARANSCVVA